MPAISVIVPVYNVEKHLRCCVDSILTQSFTDFELILVDDGSPDNCPAICGEYAAKDSRVRVIHQTNQGQAAARNHAAVQARGEWICFVDSDDLIHPQMLEALYQGIGAGVNISMCSALESDAVPDAFYMPKETAAFVCTMDEDTMEALYDERSHRCWVVWGKLIRRDIVQKLPFTVGRIYEDNAVVCRWLYEAKKVADIKEELYFYRRNPNGTTKGEFSLKKLDYLWALEEKIRFYEQVGFQKLRKRFCNVYINTAANYRRMMYQAFPQSGAADAVSKQMRRFYRKNKGFIELSADNQAWIYEAMYPRLMQLYWLWRAVLRKLGWKE